MKLMTKVALGLGCVGLTAIIVNQAQTPAAHIENIGIKDVYSRVTRTIMSAFPEKNILGTGLNPDLSAQLIDFLTSTNNLAKNETKDATRRQQLDTLFQTALFAMNTANTLHGRQVTPAEKQRYAKDIRNKKEVIDQMILALLWEQNKPTLKAMNVFDHNQKDFFENYREAAKTASPNQNQVQFLFNNKIAAIPGNLQYAPESTKNQLYGQMSALINKLEQYAYLLEHHSRYKSTAFSREANIQFARQAATTLKLLQLNLFGKEHDALAPEQGPLFNLVQKSRNRAELIFLAEANSINTVLSKLLAELAAR